MRTWSDSPFERTMPLSALDQYADADVVARDNGESSVIFEPPAFKGWLVKRYRPETKVDHRVLGKLIELPETMPPAELALVDRAIAWPVARVVEGYRTVGTIMAKAEPEFFWDMTLLGGRTRRQVVEVDHLANTADKLGKLGLPVPDTRSRLSAMSNLVACAALFEKYDIVYADWSFANAFWSPSTQNTLIIDVDASGIGRRRFVETPNWEDPLMRRNQPVTTHTDRFKVALLVTRAVTGQRKDSRAALAEMERLYPDHSQLTDLLRRALDSKTIDLRPTLAELHRAIESPVEATATTPPSGGHNVTVLRPWRPPGTRPHSSPPPPTPKRPAPKAGTRTVNAGQSTRVAPSPTKASSAQTDPLPFLLGFVGCLIVLILIGVVVFGVYQLTT
ncbi:hypothetical protein ACIBHY_51425 [Nonomuraea sp. NPDC050547]|uniref:hypothetical protein n=1 Tax=Nonomuraea sp. NPDC050547 TaxID=3364368 RepID=UPI0037B0ACB6